jgi:putative ATP-binding cassette transporter
MPLLELLRRENALERRDILVAVIASGAANAVILAVINAAARTAALETLNARLLLIFAVAMAVYVVGFKYTLDAVTQIFEQMLAKIRLRLADRIAGSELLLLDEVGKARILQSLAQDTALISESQGLLVAAGQSAIMVFFTSLYVITLSLPAFVIILAVIVAGILFYFACEQEMSQLLQRSVAEEVKFIGLTNDLIDGLKEIKLSVARGADIMSDVSEVVVMLRDLRLATTNLYNRNAIFSMGFFYVLIAIVAFVLPRLFATVSGEVPQLVASVLFIIGPLSTIVTATPAFSKSNRAAAGLIQLEAEVSRMAAAPDAPDREEVPRPLAFHDAIRCHALEFRYPGADASAFHIGPIDLAVPHGEITMLVGGNGSGKTTFLRVLTGLYQPSAGRLTLDDTAILPANRQEYRELFSAIHADFHLFRKLYGLIVEADAVRKQLDRMAIADKVDYGRDGFTTLDLSTGQRKRIAMAVTLLENRPIIVFDEWAADQDFEFRNYFYEGLLPELKAQGKTLILASHDDRYFHLADTIVKMELGQVESVERVAQA